MFGIGVVVITILLITFPTHFVLLPKPHLLVYDGSQISILHLATSSPDYTPQTFPSSSNKTLSISLLSINVPPKIAHFLENPSGIPPNP